MYIDKETKVIVFNVEDYSYADYVKLTHFKKKLKEYLEAHTTSDKCSTCNLKALCYDCKSNLKGLVLNLHRYNSLEIKIVVHAVERTIAQIHDYQCKDVCSNCKFCRFCNDMLLFINWLQTEQHFKQINF